MKKRKNPTVSHPIISCGKLEKQILRYIKTLRQDELWNTNKFANSIVHKSRSTVYEALKALRRKGLIEIPKGNYYNSRITKQGVAYLQHKNIYRTVCRESDKKSFVRDHKFTFQIPIKRFPKGWEKGTVAFIDKNTIQTNLQNFSKNNPILYANFPDDITVVFTTTKAVIKPKNIYANDHTEASTIAIIKATAMITRMQKAGFELSDSKGRLKLIQTEGHYAEVNSVLAQFFEKKAWGFSVTDTKGKTMYWIDHSDGHLEDETASEEHRENLNFNMKQFMEGQFDIKDIASKIDKLTITVEQLVKLSTEHTKQIVMLTKFHAPINNFQATELSKYPGGVY